MALQPELGGQLRAAPAECDAAPAVTIIVDEVLFAELISANHEALPAIGPEARHRADHAVLVDQHRRQRRAIAIASTRHGRAAAEQGGGPGGEGSAVEQHLPDTINSSFPRKREST